MLGTKERKGFAFLYGAAVLFAIAAIFVKYGAAFYGGFFVSGVRFAVGASLCLAVLFARYGGVKANRPWLIVARGLSGAIAMVLTYTAIGLTGPGRATLLSNVYPLFVAVFAALFFKERFNPITMISIVLCVAGSVLVVRDGSGASALGDAMALGSAAFAGIAVNFVRRASQYDNVFVLYLSPCLFGLPTLAVGAPDAIAAGFSAWHLAAAVLVGALTFAAQSMMARGYRDVPAGSGSVVFFLETLLTVAFGVAFAGEGLNLRFAIGLALIFAGLWANAALSSRIGRQKPVPV
jgi:drug/metabolite transporter (DMT)-like permease